MRSKPCYRPAWLALLLSGALSATLSMADPAVVWLKNGLRLRGDVTLTESEVILRNELGEVRYDRNLVERVVPLAPPTETEPAPATAPAPAAEAPATEAAAGPLPEPPLLSSLDIQRLKMSELRLDGPPETIRVKFTQPGDRRKIPQEVLDLLSRRPRFNPRWRHILSDGAIQEKLQLIVAATGTRYADRIEIVGDPEVFVTFRQNVLPLVVRGCARSGCHAGPEARVFRLPTAPEHNAERVYTTFAILDAIRTRHGPLIDRDDPDGSPLVCYLLPEEGNPRPHPPVSGRQRLRPVLRSREIPVYEKLVEWIDALRTPHPDYGLDYVPPLPPELRNTSTGPPGDEIPAEQKPDKP